MTDQEQLCPTCRQAVRKILWRAHELRRKTDRFVGLDAERAERFEKVADELAQVLDIVGPQAERAERYRLVLVDIAAGVCCGSCTDGDPHCDVGTAKEALKEANRAD